MTMSIAIEDDALGGVGCVPTCRTCGSEHVSKDAWACFNPATGFWEVEAVFDHEFCQACEAETSFIWTRKDAVPSLRIRALNDAFRQSGQGTGSRFITAGIQAKGQAFVEATIQTIQHFNAFSDENDPWGERVEVHGEPVFWKIDYYDPTLTAASENPANDGQTHRVLTIMLPEEY